MNIELVQFPTEQTWLEVKQRALVTIGKTSEVPPTEEWKAKILKAKHSPIRHIVFSFYITGIPYYCSTHLVRHVHALCYVKSQRNDRQSNYDRNKAPQNAPVDMIYEVNAEELITICEKRMCMQASAETREVVKQMRELVVEKCPEFKWVLQTRCDKYGICDEMFPCKRGQLLNANILE